MNQRSSKFSISRRTFIGGAAAVGAVAASAPVVTTGAQSASPVASPVASPAATAPPSIVAERASGAVRLTGFGNDIEQATIETVLQGFSAKYPNIQVSYEPIAAEYLVKIQTDIAAGNVADVFMVQNEYAQDFMSRDVLLAIDDYMAEDSVSKDMFYEPLVNAYTWEGSLYGLPKDWSPIGAVYDPDALASANVTMPTTWDELRTALQTLKAASGQPALALDPSFDRFVIFLYQAGGNITNEDVTAITLDSEEATQALEFYYGLYRDGLSATAADIGAQWPGDAFVQGLTSMVFEGNWMFPTLNDQAPDKKFEVAELPAGPAGKGTPAFTNSYSIFTGSQNPDAAWVLVNYLTGVEGARGALPLGLALPALPALESEFLAEYPERSPYLDAGRYATAVQYGPGGQTFASDANAALQSLFAGQIDVAEAQAQIVTAAQNNIQLAG
ncbi:MAG: sugar ABC transporter substrate-binding protein [Chloroflexota bacterium]|nr:sugar ABC transporter substrate-binding protein [Chloroflexota bacterium]